MREAVALADPEVDFTPYDLVFLMPPRNAPGDRVLARAELLPGAACARTAR